MHKVKERAFKISGCNIAKGSVRIILSNKHALRIGKLIKKLIATGLLLISFLSVANEQINWLVWDLSPEFIKEGKYQNQGFADNILEYFQRNLPQYKHRKVWVNTRRWGVENKKQQSCTPHVWGHFENQLYSKPYTFTEPYGIVVHKNKQHLFGIPGSTLSLVELLNNNKLVLALMPLYPVDGKGSRYPQLVSYLTPFKDNKNLLFIGSGVNEVNLKLLSSNKADYALSFSSNVSSQIRINQLSDEFVFYPLKENQLYKKIHVSCAVSSQGEKVIKDINNLINEDFFKFVYQQTKQWNNNPKFLSAIHEHYLQSKNLPNIIED